MLYVRVQALEAFAVAEAQLGEVFIVLGLVEHFVEAAVHVALPCIAGAMAAVMAQVKSLVALGRGREFHIVRGAQEVRSVKVLRMLSHKGFSIYWGHYGRFLGCLLFAGEEGRNGNN